MTDIPRYDHSRRWKASSMLGPDPTPIPSVPRTSIEFSDACIGWLATYEIFTVRELGSESSAMATIPLDAEDIAACLRQSLRFIPLGGWKCSFPLTIAPGLEKISILYNVIHFGADGTTFTVAPIPADSHPRIRLVRSPETKFLLPYSYRLFWSLDSRYLAVTDGGFQEPRAEEVAFLAIFSTAVIGEPTRLINCIGMPTKFEAWMHDCAFYPTEPLFLYRNGCSVFLWNFRDGTSRV